MKSSELKREWKRSGSKMTLKRWLRKWQPAECASWLRRKAGRQVQLEEEGNVKKTCEGIINNRYSARNGERCGRPTTGRYCGHHDPARRENHRALRKAAWQKRREALKDVRRVDARADRLAVEVLRRPVGEELKLVLGAFRRALQNGKGAVLVVAQEGA